MNRRHRLLALPVAALLLLVVAAQTLAAPPSSGPTYSATMTADKKCLLTVSATWKNDPSVATIYVLWYEAGYQNGTLPAGYVATSQWPFTGPNAGVLKGKVVTFTDGPVTRDTASHDWWAVVQFYSNTNAFITEVNAPLTTTCYQPSPA